MLLETLPAVNRPALRGPERHRGFFPALGTDRRGLCPVVAARCRLIPLRLAGLATFRIILEMLVGKEKLFSCREHKVFTAFHALQGSVMIFRIFRHGSEPPEIPRVSTRHNASSLSWPGSLKPTRLCACQWRRDFCKPRQRSLVEVASGLFPISLACQCCLDPSFLARF